MRRTKSRHRYSDDHWEKCLRSVVVKFLDLCQRVRSMLAAGKDIRDEASVVISKGACSASSASIVVKLSDCCCCYCCCRDARYETAMGTGAAFLAGNKSMRFYLMIAC